ncbi:MAG: cyclase family protein [Desulfovibrio sp.]|uniref:cyclase family protein n=1 Tax=Desulfovibrio sp. 7SRBS1 TaxID=3378064 RepID=UPI003B3E8EF2
MKIFDLTHVIQPDMPMYPGTEQPILHATFTHATHGFYERKLTMFSHTGTHMDAPAHILDGGNTLDTFEADFFYGKGCVVDCTAEGKADGGLIGLDRLAGYEGELRQADFVLLRTDWNRFWRDERYFSGFPVLTPEAAMWLAQTGLRGLGVDAISVDTMDTEDYPVHKAILGSNAVIIENLTNLGALPTGEFMFSCFPLKMVDADGSPVRAVAMA